jgi:glutamyl-tRNA synthetase
VNWALARQREWRVVMRIEDIDGPRVKAGAAEQALEELHWLGLDWDSPVSYQSEDLSPYHAALHKLYQVGWIYQCRCSRKDIAAAQSAPHEGGEMRHPGTCRPAAQPAGLTDAPSTKFSPHTASSEPAASLESADPLLQQNEIAWRLIVPDEAIRFEDAIAGPQTIDVQQQAGDFIVATKAACRRINWPSPSMTPGKG